MILKDLHVHSTYSDGKNTPREIIETAIKLGMETIGISDHSPLEFDSSYCLNNKKINEYVEEIQILKKEYKNKIEVLCGMEVDYFSSIGNYQFDYTIGSVHYIKCKEVYVPVDYNINVTTMAINELFNGDVYAYCEEYYKLVGDVVEKTNADIIGHFDLITKFNEKSPIIDEKNTRYVESYKRAIDKLIPYGKPFEINTGAISRGYRITPYPNCDILKYILKKGGKVILSSDSHSANTLMFEFLKCERLADKIGFNL